MSERPQIENVFETVLVILESGNAMFLLRDLTVHDPERELKGGYTVKIKGDKYDTQDVAMSQLLASSELESIAKRIQRRGYTPEEAYRFLAQATTKIEYESSGIQRKRKAV